MNFLQAQPPAQIKVDGVVCDYLRQKVLSKMFKFVNGKGIDGHGLGYRFTKADYSYLLYDEVLQQTVCTSNTARRWYREARNGKWKAGLGGHHNRVQNVRMTEDVNADRFAPDRPFLAGPEALLVFGVTCQESNSSFEQSSVSRKLVRPNV